ncbi:hypothetical protein Bca4012_036885 [Brassica carinata]
MSTMSSTGRLAGVVILLELSSLCGSLWLRSTKLFSMVESHQVRLSRKTIIGK